MTRSILIIGGPSNGFQFYGPFDTEDDAISYAEWLVPVESWWVKELTPAFCDEDGNWVGSPNPSVKKPTTVESINFLDELAPADPEVQEAYKKFCKGDPAVFEGYHTFRNPDTGEEYGSFEVFVSVGPDTGMPNGWYWWSCFPGCIPDGEPNGPFPTAEGAYLDALEGSPPVDTALEEGTRFERLSDGNDIGG